jgi:hypothetical protein
MTMLPWPKRSHASRRVHCGKVTYQIDAYDRDDAFGCGLSFSITNVKTRVEVRRYDLFRTGAHMHVRSEPGQPRRYFPAGLTVPDYLQLALADLVAWRPSFAEVATWMEGEVARREPQQG